MYIHYIYIIININETVLKFYRCNVLWYIAPLSSQKILLFLMQRTIKSTKAGLSFLFVASLEGFGTVM